MQPYVPLSAGSPTTNEALAAMATLLNEIQTKLPKTRVVSLALSPEIQAPSLRAPNGGMIYVAAALLQMDSDDDYKELIELAGAFQSGPVQKLQVVK